jgi:hypothetical protein
MHKLTKATVMRLIFLFSSEYNTLLNPRKFWNQGQKVLSAIFQGSKKRARQQKLKLEAKNAQCDWEERGTARLLRLKIYGRTVRRRFRSDANGGVDFCPTNTFSNISCLRIS